MFPVSNCPLDPLKHQGDERTRSIQVYSVCVCVCVCVCVYVYRVSQEEWTKLRESVPYVKLYRYNPKHLYPKLNGYGDKGQRKVWSFCGSTYCTWFA